MEDLVFNVALAGLLHDVGKFGLRAKIGASLNDPQVKSDYKRTHALHTDDFIVTYLPAQWKMKIEPLAANHHRPTQTQEYIIAIANRLSAGTPSDEGEDDSNVHPRQLLSIFSILEACQHTPAKEEWKYWPLSALALDEQTESTRFFPDQAWSDEKVYGAYAQLWREFCGQMEALKKVHTPNGGMETYLESVLLLMQRYTWCIPSAKYNGRPDTSLYDHSRMTAALAAVIAENDLPDETIKVLAEKPEECNEPIALLVGGDISGVQDFIYTITNRGATSALRGRSFYLQLLTEAAARYILRGLELPITNLIYAGGGNFFLVARATDQKKLREIQQAISRILYKHHNGDLYLAAAGVPLQASDFVQVINMRHALSRKWDDLIKELQINKQRRFTELPEDDLKTLFEPQGHGGDREGQCRVCGNEHPNAQPDEDAKTADDPEGVRKCPPCSSYENLGKKLRNAQYLVWEILPHREAPSELEPNFVSQSWEDVLADLDLKAFLAEDAGDLAGGNKNRRVTLALKERAWTGLKADSHNAVGRRIFVNVTPKVSEQDVVDFANKLEEKIKPGDIKPFSLLEMQSEGIQRLGILRMDVDNLGKIFAKGLGEYATLSRIASLSFTVSLYFEGWVGVLAEKRNHRDDQKCKDRLYSIYSGGDDLFFVGSWDEVVELAREIRADLTHYAAGHPGIHASAGIVLVGGKYPLAKAAQDAHEEEQASKHHAWWDETGKIHEKDVVNFLGQAIHWRRFGLESCDHKGIENAHALMHFLTKVLKVNNANYSLIRLLVRLDERYRKAEDKRRKAGSDQNHGGQPQPLWGPWNWLAYYYLKRRFKVEADDALKQDMDDLAEVLRGDFHMMEWLGLAARWAELSNRKPNK